MQLINQDTYTNWLRSESPGEDPKWESKCGVVTQTGFGTRLDEFKGQRWTDKTKTTLTPAVIYTTFSKAKRSVERQYFIMYPEEQNPAY